MIDEFRIAKSKNAILIPIASTGDAAQQIYEEMYETKDEYMYLFDYWDILKQERDVEKLVKIIRDIISKAM